MRISAKPMMIVAPFFRQRRNSKAGNVAQMGIPEGTDPLTALAQMPKEALSAMNEQVSEKLDKMQESIITQAGVSYVRAEYEAMGEDVDAIQMHYMMSTGIRMLCHGTGDNAGCGVCGHISFRQSGRHHLVMIFWNGVPQGYRFFQQRIS